MDSGHNMKSQKPAEGILKRWEWGDSKTYQVVCTCGQEYHDHWVEVAADQCGISVDITTTLKTDYWTDAVKTRYDIDNEVLQEAEWFWKGFVNNTIRKIKLTWELWTRSTVTMETTIHMNEQQALNYAETLKSAIKDVNTFKKSQGEKNNGT